MKTLKVTVLILQKNVIDLLLYMMFIWIDISGSLIFCSILLLQIFKIVNTCAAPYIDYVLLGGLIYSNSSYSIKSAYVCSIKLFYLKEFICLNK